MMYKYKGGQKGLLNPVKLADDAVLGLSSLERDQEIPPQVLEGGITVLNYIENLYQQSKKVDISQVIQEREFFQGIRDEIMIIKESQVDLDKEFERIEEIKSWLIRLISNPSSEKDKIQQIKAYLIKITMPIWQTNITKMGKMTR